MHAIHEAPRLVARTLILFLYLATVAHAENWTRFRGPNGSGDAGEGSFPAEWTAEDYLWEITLPGEGHGSPVGWKKRIFVTSGNHETGVVTLHCFDADTGQQHWQREFAGDTYAMHLSNSYASTTPTVDAERVYFTWCAGGQMHCAALTHTGEDIWEAELGQFTGPHGFAASPVVVDGVVCVQIDHGDTGADGYLLGLDSETGDERWRAERPAGKDTYATPCVIASGAAKAVISQSTTGGMQAIDTQSGNVLWQVADAFPQRTVSSPVAAGNMLFGTCGSGGGGKQLVGIELNGQEPPTKKLLLTKLVPYVPTPVVAGDLLFLWHDQGIVSCFALEETPSNKPLWTKRIGGNFFGSPILAGGKLYCLSMEGDAVVVAAGREFERLGKTALGAPTNATPAVHEGKMYLRTVSSLACLPKK